MARVQTRVMLPVLTPEPTPAAGAGSGSGSGSAAAKLAKPRNKYQGTPDQSASRFSRNESRPSFASGELEPIGSVHAAIDLVAGD